MCVYAIDDPLPKCRKGLWQPQQAEDQNHKKKLIPSPTKDIGNIHANFRQDQSVHQGGVMDKLYTDIGPLLLGLIDVE